MKGRGAGKKIEGLKDEAECYFVDLAAGFIAWLCSGRADWGTGRYLSADWDAKKSLIL